MTARADQPKPKTKFDLETVPARVYGLPDDGRKGRSLRDQRCRLLLHIAHYADPDGSNIWSSVATWAEVLEWDKHRVERRLSELVDRLKFVRNDGWHQMGDRATRLRSIDFEAIFSRMGLPSDSSGGLPSDSTGRQIDTPWLPSDSHGLPSDSRVASLTLEGGFPHIDDQHYQPLTNPLTSHLTNPRSENLSSICGGLQNSESRDAIGKDQRPAQEETRQEPPQLQPPRLDTSQKDFSFLKSMTRWEIVEHLVNRLPWTKEPVPRIQMILRVAAEIRWTPERAASILLMVSAEHAEDFWELFLDPEAIREQFKAFEQVA